MDFKKRNLNNTADFISIQIDRQIDRQLTKFLQILHEHLDYLPLPPPSLLSVLCMDTCFRAHIYRQVDRQIDLLCFFHWSVFGVGAGGAARHSDRTGPGIGTRGFQVVWAGRGPPCDQVAGTAECRLQSNHNQTVLTQSVQQSPSVQQLGYYSRSSFNHNYISDIQSHSDRGRRTRLKAKFFII